MLGRVQTPESRPPQNGLPKAKRKPEVRVRSYGVYSKWDTHSKQLPKFIEPTLRIPAKVDIEFGFVVNIKRAKNRVLTYCIEHPGILDEAGEVRLPFDGEVYVKTNDWDFYLGDTIWLPLDDKLGAWRMWIAFDDEILVEKTFHIEPTDDLPGQT